jgi:hypothetical protein
MESPDRLPDPLPAPLASLVRDRGLYRFIEESYPDDRRVFEVLTLLLPADEWAERPERLDPAWESRVTAFGHVLALKLS